MIFRVVVISLFLSASGSALAQSVVEPLPSDIPRHCDIRIEFGSYAIGIDTNSYELIVAKSGQDSRITERHIDALHKEGERSLCLTTPDETSAVYDTLLPLVPTESRAGWVRISERDGRSFTSAWPKSWAPNQRFRQ